MLKIKIGLLVWLLSISLARAAVLETELETELEFKPSAADPSNNKFIIKTRSTGYCYSKPEYCGEHRSFDTGITSTSRILDHQSEDIRHHTYQALDAVSRPVRLTHTITGQPITVNFRLNLMAQRFNNYVGGGVGFDSAGRYPLGGCEGTIGAGADVFYFFGWKHPEGNTACYRRLKSSGPTLARMYELSIGYELTAPDPMAIPNGTYTGQVRYTVGNHQDIDWGQADYSDHEVTINIIARVEHLFAVRVPAGEERVLLEPPGGWDAFIRGGTVPSSLRRDARLLLTSSGDLKLSLRCEHQAGDGCGLRSNIDNAVAPLNVAVSLPGMATSSGGSMINRRLTTGSDLELKTTTFGVERPSQVHFSTPQEATREIVGQRGSHWRGAVTLVFDAEI